MISLHRFRNLVAINPFNGHTYYLTPEKARAFGQELINYANDIENVRFTDSKLAATIITGAGIEDADRASPEAES